MSLEVAIAPSELHCFLIINTQVSFWTILYWTNYVMKAKYFFIYKIWQEGVYVAPSLQPFLCTPFLIVKWINYRGVTTIS